MTQCNNLDVKLSNSQLKKLKSGIKNGTELTLNLSSNTVASSNDETNFHHKLLLTNTQVSKIRTAFANGSSNNITFSKNSFVSDETVRRISFTTIWSINENNKFNAKFI